MDNSNSNVETSNIDKLNDIDVEQLDISNTDKLQLKAIKQMSERLKKLEKEQSDKLVYRLPVQICNYSLFYSIILTCKINIIN